MIEKLAVKTGMRVSVELLTEDGTREPVEFDLVPDDLADFAQGFVGEGTPLAQAILGAAAGDILPYQVDDIRQVLVITVAPSQRVPPKDTPERRTAALRSALDNVEHTNALIFAASYSSKWGDYDPDGLLTNLEEDRGTDSEAGEIPGGDRT